MATYHVKREEIFEVEADSVVDAIKTIKYGDRRIPNISRFYAHNIATLIPVCELCEQLKNNSGKKANSL